MLKGTIAKRILTFAALAFGAFSLIQKAEAAVCAGSAGLIAIPGTAVDAIGINYSASTDTCSVSADDGPTLESPNTMEMRLGIIAGFFPISGATKAKMGLSLSSSIV